MDKTKRHEKTPGEHASEMQNFGETNFFREIEELARNEHTQTLAQLTGAKKSHALLILLARRLDRQDAEIAALKREVLNLNSQKV